MPSLFLLGIIEHRDQPHSPIRYFTQEDINQGKIMYRPPTAAPHLQEIMAFSFAGNAFFLYFETPKLLLVVLQGILLIKPYFVPPVWQGPNGPWRSSGEQKRGRNPGLGEFGDPRYRDRICSIIPVMNV